MRLKIRFLVILFLCAFFPACEETNNNDLKVDRITYGDCKPGIKGSENAESIEYTTVDENYLSVNHVNVLFNCEPGQLFVDVEIQDDTIFVNESEEQSLVNCICPYDLSYRIGPLSYGNYQFVLLQGGLQRNQFLIDFNSTTEGIFEFKCGYDGETIDITNQCVFPELFTNQCFWGSAGQEYDEIVFVSNEEFNLFANSVRIYPQNLNCDTAEVPYIDFDTYSLLAKYTSGGGCEVEYIRKVYKNINDKTIIYEIDVKYNGNCEMLITNRNWVLIPKLSNNYLVEFVVHEH